jgi:hypothetical protein
METLKKVRLICEEKVKTLTINWQDRFQVHKLYRQLTLQLKIKSNNLGKTYQNPPKKLISDMTILTQFISR